MPHPRLPLLKQWIPSGHPAVFGIGTPDRGSEKRWSDDHDDHDYGSSWKRSRSNDWWGSNDWKKSGSSWNKGGQWNQGGQWNKGGQGGRWNQGGQGGRWEAKDEQTISARTAEQMISAVRAELKGIKDKDD